MVSTTQLKKLNAGSGLFFGLFLAVHLACHYTLNVGLEEANANLRRARQLYHNPLFEVLLLLSVLMHMGTNTLLYRKRQKSGAAAKKEGGGSKKVKGSTELQVHRVAGYFLVFSIVGHVIATRIGPLFVLNHPNEYEYGFVTYAYQIFPLNIFPVYLALFAMAGGWHLIYGTRSALATLSGSSVVGKPFPMALKALALASHLLVIAAVVALGGAWDKIKDDPKQEMRKEYYDTMGI